jgi:hypothetical protein
MDLLPLVRTGHAHSSHTRRAAVAVWLLLVQGLLYRILGRNAPAEKLALHDVSSKYHDHGCLRFFDIVVESKQQ